jgi:hypothetical protein
LGLGQHLQRVIIFVHYKKEALVLFLHQLSFISYGISHHLTHCRSILSFHFRRSRTLTTHRVSLLILS